MTKQGKWLEQIIKEGPNTPEYRATFISGTKRHRGNTYDQTLLKPNLSTEKRNGRPRLKWTEETMQQYEEAAQINNEPLDNYIFKLATNSP